MNTDGGRLTIPRAPGRWTQGGPAEWGLALGSLTLCLGLLLAAERAVERLNVVDAEDDLAKLHEHSALYGWTPRSGSRYLLDGRRTTINAKGYRGPVVAPERSAGVRRIVMLGDSIAFGTHVGDDESFAHLVDAWDDGLEVVNLAVQGYGLDQSLLKLVHEGLSYSPDLVVLNVCVDNDLVDTALPAFLYDGRYPKPYYRVEGGQLVLRDEHLQRSSAERLGAMLKRHSALYAWLTSRTVGADPASTTKEHWAQRRARALLDIDAIVTLSFRLVERMREVAAEHGAGFVVVLHPGKASFLEGSKWVDAFLASPRLAGIPVIDMRREYLEQRILWTDLALDGIGHLSASGHRTAATILQGLLRQEALSSHRARGRPQADRRCPSKSKTAA